MECIRKCLKKAYKLVKFKFKFIFNKNIKLDLKKIKKIFFYKKGWRPSIK